jgi:methyltransferase (TIGR00027 family)
MSATEGDIIHVSDTALMVAACRALESQSEAGFVIDPFGAELAGARGMAILRALPNPKFMQFGVGVRTRFIDELLLDALTTKAIATVLSVGCGLDTRPWRLDLPPDLHWIEVDFAQMLDYKDSVMREHRPRCRRTRLTADVSDASERLAVYSAAGPAPALMITEGLLMYLPAATVEALASEVGQQSSVAYWISDITTTAFSKAINVETPHGVQSVRAPDALPGEQIYEILRQKGWVTEWRRSYITDMEFATQRIQQLFGDFRQSDRSAAVAPPTDDPTGVHLFSWE